MKTPIINFINEYKNENKIRFHMPGHKGKNVLGCEELDITEIDGADNLFLPQGIILESMKNASSIFNCPTFYSTEGSSLCIRSMLYLAYINRKNKTTRPYVLAARNIHKTFISAAALIDFDVEFLYTKDTYHSSNIDLNELDNTFKNLKELPFALYITSPDYLGNILDIKNISIVCKKYDILLLVDNAHGAYLKFMSMHPIELGADMCCDSAHKTLHALTGAAYLHINENLNIKENEVYDALSLFASTSPSYLILQSLDNVNDYIDKNINRYEEYIDYIKQIRCALINNGYKLIGEEIFKITIDSKEYGYLGMDIASYLNDNGIVCEFYDDDYVVLMISISNTLLELDKLKNVLLSLEKKAKIITKKYNIIPKKRIMSIREAVFSKKEEIDVCDAENRILAQAAISCPPAIPIVICGERIDLRDIEMFKYYNISKCVVVKE